MSLQDRMEQILKNIHLLFSESKPYDEDGTWIIVEKEKVFEQLEQLNLAVYDMMDSYEMTNQKHQLAQRRCEKQGEEIIRKASSHADDIYAASIMYTDDAINRICHIMDDANDSVRKIFRGLNNEMERERERVRHNQLEQASFRILQIPISISGLLKKSIKNWNESIWKKSRRGRKNVSKTKESLILIFSLKFVLMKSIWSEERDIMN